MLQTWREIDGEEDEQVTMSIVEKWLYEKSTNKTAFMNKLEDRQSLKRKLEHALYVLHLFANYFGSFCHTLQSIGLIQRNTSLSLLHNVLALFDSLLLHFHYPQIPECNKKMKESWNKMFVFSLVWGLGGYLTEKQRTKLHQELSTQKAALCIKVHLLCWPQHWYPTLKIISTTEYEEEVVNSDNCIGELKIPGQGVLADNVFFYNILLKDQTAEWIRWTNCVEAQPADSIKRLNNLVIPTVKANQQKP